MNDTSPDRHILFVTGEYPPLTGGVGAYTERLAHALAELRWRTSVVTTDGLAGCEYATPVSVYPLVRRWDWRIWNAIPRLAAEVGATWLHVQYQTAAFGMNPSINLAISHWKNAGCRVAWTYHDLLVPYLFPKAGQRLRSYVTRVPARNADLTVVTNEDDRLQLAGVAAHLARIPIGSNIPAVEVSAGERTAMRARLGYAPEDLVLAYFGFLNRSKGGLTLVRTLAEVRRQRPDASLLMIGERVGASDPTNYAYLQEVEALVEELELGQFVRWTGRLDDRQVSHALAAADVLFMPYEDGASLRRGTLMAGLAHGCAIVTTHPQAPTPELSNGRELLYVPRADAQASSAAILRIAGDTALAARLRSSASAASKQFTWEEIARQHAGLYDALAR